MTAPQMNHTEYMKKVKKLSEESLRYIIKDCREAMEALPENPKNGYYADEIHYCAMELFRRKNALK
jgi:DNA modification methylase